MKNRSRIVIALKILLGLIATSAISVALLVSFVSQARAELTRSLRDVGDGMWELGGEQTVSGARTLHINGAVVTINSGTVADDLATVLGRARSQCGSDDGLLDFTLRDRTEIDGFVGCFSGYARLSALEMLDLVDAFANSGDLSGLGPFQYTYARVTPSGTHVLHATLSSVDVEAMFPDDRDAPGFDAPGIPRPRGSRRLLSAVQEGSPYHIAVYTDVSGEIVELRDSYTESLRAAGWDVYPGSHSETLSQLFAFRDGIQSLIVMRSGPEGLAVSIATGL